MYTRGLALSFVIIFLTVTGHTQTAIQTVILRPGWNSVLLEVEPSNQHAKSVFDGLPVESVWSYSPRKMQDFLHDANEMVPSMDPWMVYFPTNSANRSLNSLYFVEAGRPYLVKSSASTNVTWRLEGVPLLPKADWQADSYNLRGFYVSETNAPSFAQFLAGVASLAGQKIYRLDASGEWKGVDTQQRIVRGEAYWMWCAGPSDFTGTAKVSGVPARGLEFSSLGAEQTLELRNTSRGESTFRVRFVPSPGVTPIPLGIWKLEAAENPGPLNSDLVTDYAPLASGSAVTLGSQDSQVVRIGFLRHLLPESAIGKSVGGCLEITDSAGSKVLVSISAGTSKAVGSSLSRLSASTGGAFTGLWFGNVLLTNVSESASTQDKNATTPAASPFDFQVLLHVSASGEARLLQRALIMKTRGPNPALVLVADESKAANYDPIAARESLPVARRYSAPVFGFRSPIRAAVNGGFGVGKCEFVIDVDADESLNPFLHRYHPDHDNLSENNETESFSFRRSVSLQFLSEDPMQRSQPGWGKTQLGGAYTEVITGIHRRPLIVAGAFKLYLVSDVAQIVE